MPHPLSEIITARLNGDDPHTRTTITNAEAVEMRAELDRMHEADQLHKIATELHAARSIDIETASILVQALMAELPDANVADVVEELRQRKPFLFADAAKSGSHLRPDSGRSELLRYLRSRRAAQ